VLELRADDEEAGLAALNVEYSIDGLLYRTTSNNAVIFASGGDDACTRQPVEE